MMKRQDLVKQFELVVKQEIKNHNDAVTASNAAVEALKSKLVELAHKQSKDVAAYQSGLSLLSSGIKKCEDAIQKSSDLRDSKINDANVISVKLSRRVDEVSEKASSLEKALLNLNSDINSVKSIVRSVNDECSRVLKIIKHDLDLHHNRSCNELVKMERSILDRPTEDLKLRKDLEKSLKEKDTSISGLKEHLDHVEKKNSYMEKQIEDLYNTIERMKKRV